MTALPSADEDSLPTSVVSSPSRENVIFTLPPGQTSYGRHLSDTNPKHSDVELFLRRRSRVYSPNEKVEGVLCLTVRDGWNHGDLEVCATGNVCLSHNSNAPPQTTETVLDRRVLVKPRGYLVRGVHVLPFAFLLVGDGGARLPETLRGTNIAVKYHLRSVVERGMFRRTLESYLEFAVVAKGDGGGGDSGFPREDLPIRLLPHSVKMDVSALELRDRPGESPLPNFRMTGALAAIKPMHPIEEPLAGNVTVEWCDAPIRSIEVRLMRWEGVRRTGAARTSGQYESFHNPIKTEEIIRSSDRQAIDAHQEWSERRDSPSAVAYPFSTATHQPTQCFAWNAPTEVQRVQVADGDVTRNVPIPFVIPFRPFQTCPTVTDLPEFQIKYEIEAMILFCSGTMVRQAYPVTLCRMGR